MKSEVFLSSKFRVQSSEFRVQSSEFRVQPSLVFNQLHRFRETIVLNPQIVDSGCIVAHVEGIAIGAGKAINMVIKDCLAGIVAQDQVEVILLDPADLEIKLIL